MKQLPREEKIVQMVLSDVLPTPTTQSLQDSTFPTPTLSPNSTIISSNSPSPHPTSPAGNLSPNTTTTYSNSPSLPSPSTRHLSPNTTTNSSNPSPTPPTTPSSSNNTNIPPHHASLCRKVVALPNLYRQELQDYINTNQELKEVHFPL